jgi:serpin B
MIDKILDRIEDDAVMYLINALAFDGRWQNVYDKSAINKGTFTNINGEEVSAEMMHSEEMTYLQDAFATGFMKPYQDGKYSFAAMLPNEGVDLYDYISGLTSEGLLETLHKAQSGTVIATLPKFSYEYDLSMNDALKKLGMPTAFDGMSADFSKMAHSSRGNIYIGDVLHKTFIAVDELGTKAGAVTKVEMNDRCAFVTRWVVTLDRPFVYMIIDNETNLPVFIGTVVDILD